MNTHDSQSSIFETLTPFSQTGSDPSGCKPTPTPTPTPHRATQKEWQKITQYAREHSCNYSSVILELAARVEFMEAQQQQAAPCPHVRTSDEGTSYCGLAEQQAEQPAAPAPAEDSDSELVRQVANAIVSCLSGDFDHPIELWLPEARKSVRVVARWLRANGWNEAPDRLEQEVRGNV